jgi:hypothetical protein
MVAGSGGGSARAGKFMGEVLCRFVREFVSVCGCSCVHACLCTV